MCVRRIAFSRSRRRLQVLLYSATTRRLLRQLTRFRDTAYSGCLRGDGGAVAAGCEDGFVRLFDAGSRSLLRQLPGHGGRAARCVRYAPDRARVLSCGDDGSARWWDVATGAQLRRLDGHTDYVRSASHAAASSSSADSEGLLWATGSYDHTVLLWDLRQEAPVMTLRHGQQVEDVCFFPLGGGGTLASAGGDAVVVWDVVAGGRARARLRPHAKAVTCVRIYAGCGPALASPADAAAGGGGGSPRMLTGSLDGTVAVHEIDGFTRTHSVRYPAPVLCLAVAPDAASLAVGCADGTLALRSRKLPPKAPVTAAGRGGSGGEGAFVSGAGPANTRTPGIERTGKYLDAGSYRYFVRGQSSKAAAGEAAVAARVSSRLAPHDAALRRFRHRDALDAALSSRSPSAVAAVVDALAARGALPAALAGRDAPALLPLLLFLAKHVGHPRHAARLAPVADTVLDIYTDAVGADAACDAALRTLSQRLGEATHGLEKLFALQGAVEALLAARGG